VSGSSDGVLVFGAYGGIGAAVARRLGASGVRLALSGRDSHRLKSLAQELDAMAVPADASVFSEVDDAVTRSVEELGSLAGVVSCVGSVLLKPAHLTSEEEFQATVQTNLTSAFAVLRASVRPMIRSGGGSIVLVSTAAAQIGLPNHEAIAAAKGGIDSLARSAAATYGRRGIRVNVVSPGLVETPLTERITSSEAARASSEAMHALGRIGKPDDVAGAVAWLLSDEAAWVTGQTLGVDGGLGSARSA
jgi:3-oxoacyl-[acyl-carrier protein] reductase